MRIPMEVCCVLVGMKLVSRAWVHVKELRVHRIESNQLVLGRYLVSPFARHILHMPKYRLTVTCRKIYEIECILATMLKIVSSVEPKLVLLERTAQISRGTLIIVNGIARGDTNACRAGVKLVDCSALLSPVPS